MKMIGFSTGALALGDFVRGIEISRQHQLRAVELSALRFFELKPLIEALPDLDLSGFQYVSLHAPSRYDDREESTVIDLVQKAAERKIPVVVHPDAIRDARGWRSLGRMLLIENMDSRKAIGRSVPDLAHFFGLLPEAGFCFDIGHARQFDPSMTEAELLLAEYRDRIRQLHVSEVNTFCRHEPLSYLSYFSYRRVAARIPEEAPVILEAVVEEWAVEREVRFAIECLTPPSSARTAPADAAFVPSPATGD